MRAPDNYQRVDLSDEDEVEYWLVVLDTTREQLEQAVDRVGDSAAAVRDRLRKPDRWLDQQLRFNG